MTENTAPNPDSNNAAAPAETATRGAQPWLTFWREKLSSPRRAWNTMAEFSEELRADPAFWPHVMAMRGGAIMTAFVTVGLIAYAMTLPFALAATVVAASAVLVGAVGIGLAHTGRFAWSHIRRAFHAVKHGDDVPMPPRKKPRPAWMRKIAGHKFVRAVGGSAAWREAGEFIQTQKKWMLGGTALGGSALTAGMGVWMLTAQILVLPVVVVGSAVSVAALWSVGSIVTGCVGLYFGTTSLLRWHRAGKSAAQETGVAGIPVTENAVAPPAPPPVSPAFTAAAPKNGATPGPDKKTSPPAPPPAKI
jgi:hypothetical protein